jgi:hypothetical protein
VDERREDLHIDAEQQAKYTNYFKIGFNALEFVFDLGQAYDDSPRALRHTRIITSPAYAKALLQLLAESLTAYERAHGAIPRLEAGKRSES